MNAEARTLAAKLRDSARARVHASNIMAGKQGEATHQQNGWNSRAPGPWKKGVSFHRRDRRFYAAITLPSRKRKFLGSFATEDEAHSAYMDAARSHFGEFARAA